MKQKLLGRNEWVTEPDAHRAVEMYQQVLNVGESIEIEGANFRFAYRRNALNNTPEKVFYAKCPGGNRNNEWRVDYQCADDVYRITRQEVAA